MIFVMSIVLFLPGFVSTGKSMNGMKGRCRQVYYAHTAAKTCTQNHTIPLIMHKAQKAADGKWLGAGYGLGQ